MFDPIKNENVKILVVDDVIQNIQVIGNLLMEQRYQVVYALGGAEALGLIDKTSFDLILLDILMPQPDGYEVCKVVKSNPVTKDTPIIFLTAKSDLQSIIEGFELGAQDYVSKPFKAEELLARVKTQIQLKKQREQFESMNLLLEEKVNKRTEDLNKANKKLAILEKAKSDFLLLISHELRTPLNVINGFIEILQSLVTSDEQLQSINYLRTSTDKLINLAETALLITEIKLGKYSIKFEKVSLIKISQMVLEDLKAEIEVKYLEIKTDIIITDDTISGDSRLIFDIIKRIIHNAIKVTPTQSTIRIIIESNDRYLNYSVLDEGPGFDHKEITGLFEVFSKSPARFDNNGSGLSLAASKLIMDIHSGTITAENRGEKGAVVTLSFPV